MFSNENRPVTKNPSNPLPSNLHRTMMVACSNNIFLMAYMIYFVWGLLLITKLGSFPDDVELRCHPIKVRNRMLGLLAAQFGFFLLNCLCMAVDIAVALFAINSEKSIWNGIMTMTKTIIHLMQVIVVLGTIVLCGMVAHVAAPCPDGNSKYLFGYALCIAVGTPLTLVAQCFATGAISISMCQNCYYSVRRKRYESM